MDQAPKYNANNDFLRPVEVGEGVVRFRRLTRQQILQELQKFENWISEGDLNVFWFDYLKYLKGEKKEYLPINWYFDMRDKFLYGTPEDRKIDWRITQRIKAIDQAMARKKMQLAQKGALRESSVIFELKAQHQWREGDAPNQITMNVAVQGLSPEALEKRIQNLLAKGSASERIERLKAIDAEYTEEGGGDEPSSKN